MAQRVGFDAAESLCFTGGNPSEHRFLLSYVDDQTVFLVPIVVKAYRRSKSLIVQQKVLQDREERMSKLKRLQGPRLNDGLGLIPLEVIALEMGVSRQRVHQIYARALSKVRIVLWERHGISGVAEVVDFDADLPER